MKHEKRNKHKSCEHKNMGVRDQSQVKIKFKKFEKSKSVPKDVPKSHNDDKGEGSQVESQREGVYTEYRTLSI